VRLGVLVSGAGTNLQALIDAGRRGELGPATIEVVVSNKPGVQALERAAAAGIPHRVVEHGRFTARADFEDALLEILRGARVEAVVLAGFMRILTARFVAAYPGRIVNTHPALCPAFPGVDAPRQALAYGVKLTGCTVHLVDAGVDTGPILLQAAVAVEPGDDAATLHDRIRVEEHKLLPAAVRLLAEGRVALDGRRVSLG
jgi:phosphoribosylglycinamide formyltransferase-1